ncbi:hypothetical protein [Stenotrophomonas humi]
MPKLERVSLLFRSRIAWISVSGMVILNIAACTGQNRSEAPMSTTNKVEEAAAPLRKLKANPAQAYEIRLTLRNPPGPFASVAGVTQFDVVNHALCGEIVPIAGIAGRISSNEDFALTKVSDSEYAGIMYADQIIDEDYFGRGVCHWALSEARVVLKGTGADSDTRFVLGIPADVIRAGGSEERYFWKGYYPKAKMHAFRDIGDRNLDAVPADKRDEFFVIELSARAVSP